MAIFFLLSSLSLAEPGDSIIRLTTLDYVLDGTAATVGGIAGFAVVGYLTLTATSMTDITGENFSKEAALGLGYAVGMPLGAAFGLDNAARIRGRASSFKIPFKNAEIGAMIGIVAVMVGGIIATDVKYWVAMAALPLPIISSIAGYHRWINLHQNTLQNGDAILHDCKLSCRLWECELR